MRPTAVSVRSGAESGFHSSEPAAWSAAPPRVVALGGGTGLPNVLRGLRPLLYGEDERAREFAPRDRLVAIVATSDDGGSSVNCARRSTSFRRVISGTASRRSLTTTP